MERTGKNSPLRARALKGDDNSIHGLAGNTHDFDHIPNAIHDISKAPQGLLSPPAPRPATFRRNSCIVTSACLLLVAGALLIFSVLPHSGGTASRPDNLNFITVNGTFFQDGNLPFFIVGFNVDNIVEAAIPEVSSRKVSPGTPTGRQMVIGVLSSASDAGLNLLRTWAHTTDPGHPLQKHAGKYDENVFEALDYVIAQAGRVGIRVTLSFVDNWRYRGGVSEFVDWSKTAPKRVPEYPPLIIQGDMTPETMTAEREEYESRRSALFFTDKDCREAYKAHMKAVLSRRNVFTGVKYADDPNIFSFGLINEPRCATRYIPECGDLLQKWIEEMALHFRTLDSRHLLTIGEEGFWASGDDSRKRNPGAADGSTWATEMGQDFVRNHAAPGISYAGIHVWPDNWNEHSDTFMTEWLERHAADAEHRLSMPLLLEEVGKKVEPAPGSPAQLKKHRDPVYRNVYSTIERSLANAGALQGSLLWEMDFRIYDSSPASPYGVKAQDSTFAIVKQHAQHVKLQAMQRKSGECWVGKMSMLGFVRRCYHLSAQAQACEALGPSLGTTASPSKKTVTKNAILSQGEESGELSNSFEGAEGGGGFASKAECCETGRGAFADGCTLW